MDFLKRIFGGGGPSGPPGDRDGLYFYVRSDDSGEVIRVRLNRANDLSLADEGKGYYVRKVIVGTKSFNRIEAEFFFDGNRRFMSADVQGGELVDAADYDAYLAQQSADAEG